MSKSLDPYKQIPFQRDDRWTFSTTAPFTPTYVTSNLSLSSDPMALYNTRVKGRQIFLENNPTRESRWKKELEAKRARKQKDRERKKLGAISKKQVKEMGLWKLDKSQAKFHLFLPLHRLWMGYMSELLGLKPRPSQPVSNPVDYMPNSSVMHPKLLKADFHGSIMTVVQSKNPCLVGLSGIVIHETENTFRVVTKDDELKVLPKQNAIYTFAVPLYSIMPSPSFESAAAAASDSVGQENRQTVLDFEHIQFRLFGNQFRFRAADRAGRKFKHKETIEL